MEVGSCEMWRWGRVNCGRRGVWNVDVGACETWRCVECGGGVV